MGSKPKLIDTSGSRLPKKNRINQAELTVSGDQLQLNENPVGNSSAVPGGDSYQIQFNYNGVFAGDSGLYFKPGNKSIILGGVNNNSDFFKENLSLFYVSTKKQVSKTF